MRLRLKKEILTKIEESGTIVGSIADVLGRHYTSMPYLLRKNHPTLIRKDVLMVISKELNLPEDDLTESYAGKKNGKKSKANGKVKTITE